MLSRHYFDWMTKVSSQRHRQYNLWHMFIFMLIFSKYSCYNGPETFMNAGIAPSWTNRNSCNALEVNKSCADKFASIVPTPLTTTQIRQGDVYQVLGEPFTPKYPPGEDCSMYKGIGSDSCDLARNWNGEMKLQKFSTSNPGADQSNIYQVQGSGGFSQGTSVFDNKSILASSQPDVCDGIAGARQVPNANFGGSFINQNVLNNGPKSPIPTISPSGSYPIANPIPSMRNYETNTSQTTTVDPIINITTVPSIPSTNGGPDSIISGSLNQPLSFSDTSNTVPTSSVGPYLASTDIANSKNSIDQSQRQMDMLDMISQDVVSRIPTPSVQKVCDPPVVQIANRAAIECDKNRVRAVVTEAGKKIEQMILLDLLRFFNQANPAFSAISQKGAQAISNFRQSIQSIGPAYQSLLSRVSASALCPADVPRTLGLPSKWEAEIYKRLADLLVKSVSESGNNFTRKTCAVQPNQGMFCPPNRINSSITNQGGVMMSNSGIAGMNSAYCPPQFTEASNILNRYDQASTQNTLGPNSQKIASQARIGNCGPINTVDFEANNCTPGTGQSYNQNNCHRPNDSSLDPSQLLNLPPGTVVSSCEAKEILNDAVRTYKCAQEFLNQPKKSNKACPKELIFKPEHAREISTLFNKALFEIIAAQRDEIKKINRDKGSRPKSRIHEPEETAERLSGEADKCQRELEKYEKNCEKEIAKHAKTLSTTCPIPVPCCLKTKRHHSRKNRKPHYLKNRIHNHNYMLKNITPAKVSTSLLKGHRHVKDLSNSLKTDRKSDISQKDENSRTESDDYSTTSSHYGSEYEENIYGDEKHGQNETRNPQNRKSRRSSYISDHDSQFTSNTADFEDFDSSLEKESHEHSESIQDFHEDESDFESDQKEVFQARNDSQLVDLDTKSIQENNNASNSSSDPDDSESDSTTDMHEIERTIPNSSQENLKKTINTAKKESDINDITVSNHSQQIDQYKNQFFKKADNNDATTLKLNDRGQKTDPANYSSMLVHRKFANKSFTKKKTDLPKISLHKSRKHKPTTPDSHLYHSNHISDRNQKDTESKKNFKNV